MTDAARSIYLEDIPLEEARARLYSALRAAGRDQPLPGERVDLAAALGRITAEPVWARLSSPHYHAAAMDGFAVKAAVTFHAAETRPLRLSVGREAHPVNTGDPLPSDTDAVIMIEEVQQPTPELIEIRASAAPYQHVRQMGEDIVASELALPVNHRIRPVDLGGAAGCGYDRLSVRRKPFVVIVPTGSELVPAGQTPQPGQIIEYNSLVLGAQVIEAGGRVEVSAIVPDDLTALGAALDEALVRQPDLILLLSGSSAGSRDFAASAIRSRGTLLVHGIAVRPGHPVVIGMIRETPVIGVPGYPVSAALTGELLIVPLLARWLGVPTGAPSPVDDAPRAQAILTRKLVSPIGDDDFVRVTLGQVGDRLLASPLSRGAGVITSLVRADGLAHIPRFSEGVDAGQAVEVRLYRRMNSVEHTVVISGSHDPLLDLLGQFMTERHPAYRLTSAAVGSLGGLIALRRGEAHLAGVHLLDPDTGDYNLPAVNKYLPGEPVQIVTFAHREQGFMVAPGNLLGIQGIADLPRVRYVNRQRGAGTRVLLDYELRRAGIDPARIVGYEREENTHLAVAAAVASGIADCGMGVRQAAMTMGLDFVAAGWERYDFVIPIAHLDHPGVGYLLETLEDPAFRQALAAQPGYDAREMGRVQRRS